MALKTKIALFSLGLCLFLSAFGGLGEPVMAQETCGGVSVEVVNVDGTPLQGNPKAGKAYKVIPKFSGTCPGEFNQYCVKLVGSAKEPTCVQESVKNQPQEFTFPNSSQVVISLYVTDKNGNTISTVGYSQGFQIDADSSSSPGNPGGQNSNPTGPGLGSGLPGAVSPDAIIGSFSSPIKYDSIGQLSVGVINTAIAFIGALSLLFIIIGGVRMVTSAGNEAGVTAGKKTVIWAVVGLVIALLAFTIIAGLEAILGRS